MPLAGDGALARRCGLGSTSTVTLQAARDEAVRLRAVVKDGGDPTVERRTERTEARATLASTVKRYSSQILDTPA